MNNLGNATAVRANDVTAVANKAAHYNGLLGNVEPSRHQAIEAKPLKSCMRNPFVTKQQNRTLNAVSFKPTAFMSFVENISDGRSEYLDKANMTRRISSDVRVLMDCLSLWGIDRDFYDNNKYSVDMMLCREVGISSRGLEGYLFNNGNRVTAKRKINREATLLSVSNLADKVVPAGSTVSIANELEQDVARAEGILDECAAIQDEQPMTVDPNAMEIEGLSITLCKC